MIIETVVTKRLVELAFSILGKSASKLNISITTAKPDIEQGISQHVKQVAAWAEEVSFKDLRQSKQTEEIYVPLDILVFPTRRRIDRSEVIESLPIQELLVEHSGNIVLSGQPGAGKTTTAKWICRNLIMRESFMGDRFAFPLLLRFRDLRSYVDDGDLSGGGDILSTFICATLGVSFKIDPAEKKNLKEIKNTRRQILIDLLESIAPFLILEGFDELPSLRDRDRVIEELKFYAERLEKCSFFLTCRSGDFGYSVSGTTEFEISPLTSDQISDFCQKWLDDDTKASSCVEQIYKSPFADTAIRPLFLSHLCAIYERIGRIPDKPKTVYRKIIALLLDEWDEQRFVRRVSEYADFQTDRKMDFLSNLAYELTVTLQKTEFSSRDLGVVYKSICSRFDLDPNDSVNVVAELESHHGILIASGFERYQFGHKSIQEYLTGEYIVGLPTPIADPVVVEKLPNELAIALTISSNATEYLSTIVAEVFVKGALPRLFYESFLERLILEKPEFGNSQNSVIGLAALYSRYVETALNDSGPELRIPVYLEKMEKLIAQVGKGQERDWILEFYNFKKETTLRRTIPLRLLNLAVSKEGGDYRPSGIRQKKKWGSMQNEFPKKLYLRKSFLD